MRTWTPLSESTMMRTMSMRSVLVMVGALSVVALGCAGTTPQPSAAETPGAAEAQDVDGPSGEASKLPEPAPAEPYAKLLEIKPGKDNPADRRAHVELFNPTNKSCMIKSYKLTWGDSSKQMPLDNMTLGAGNSRQRYLTVHPSDGDIDSLSVEGAAIELEAECR